uniref:Uncharacterized protein n=1 Tax=Melopsittacus undulatus TaxID=13146 RepID=A0A8V5H204_MELUD
LKRLLGAGRGGAPARGPPRGPAPAGPARADAGCADRRPARPPRAPAARALARRGDPPAPPGQRGAGRRRRARPTAAAARQLQRGGRPPLGRRAGGSGGGRRGGRAAPAAAGAIHGKGPARVQSRRRAAARAGVARGASSSRGARPAPLRAPARPTQPLEPILIRSYGSGLPTSLTYIVPTCQRLFTLETCCGYGYGPARDLHPLPRIFTGQRELTGRRRNRDAFQGGGPLSRGEPIPGRPALHKEKRTLPGAPAGFSGIGCVTALGASRRPSPPLRIRGSEPDSLSIG